MFAMFFGYTPFQRVSDKGLGTIEENRAVIRRIRKGFKGFPKKGRVSSDARKLISSLLLMDPSKRYTARQALMHPWFETASQIDEIPDSVLKQLERVSAIDNFKVFVLSALRDDTDLTITKQLKKYFDKFDRNRDERISFREFENGLRRFLPELRSHEISKMFAALDIDGDNYIQFDEFWSIIAYQQLISAYERLAVIFDRLDSNSNGYLDRGDISSFKQAIDDDPLMRRLHIDPYEIIESADLNYDGRVSFDEFMFAMHPELVEPEKRLLLIKSKRFPLNVSRYRTSQNSYEKIRGRPYQTQNQVQDEDSDSSLDEPLRQNSFDRILNNVFNPDLSASSSASGGLVLSTKDKDSFYDQRNCSNGQKLRISRPKSVSFDMKDDDNFKSFKNPWYACNSY